MICIDTNVLVRYLVQDDPEQSVLANRLIDGLSAECPGFIALLTLAELVWVLRRAYGYRRELIQQALAAILTTVEFHIEDRPLALAALQAYENGCGDYADCLIVHGALRAGCETIYTFDRKAARHAGFRLLA
ncbi:hypothetical protein MIT9_P1590 [Methylomarinovum caldicuralii]|uniref:Ribonuclease VapC n=1 Tax=Methylomarinovum caldicuralii TaxID=438856 RepID=A0AAU9BSX8_9GAMM|nr:type II toxin-antitoxin system VapC family toxin [Methylomarinovum caldicuralii]BCX82008.1 hypothetical protein MIT9_P1590 [Methylomarinovum caldicuralii]